MKRNASAPTTARAARAGHALRGSRRFRPGVFASGLFCGALLLLAGGLTGCQSGRGQAASGNTPARAEVPGPDHNPEVQPHLDQFARTEALILRWDSLRANGRNPEAESLKPSITESVDQDYPTFARAARGELGLHAQYLAVSALGFASSPDATTILVDQVAGRDGQLAGNALIALGVRADPRTPVDLIIARIGPTQPLEVKRYAPLAMAKVWEAQAAAGMPASQGQERQAMARLGAIVVDPDPITRLHVARALGSMRIRGTYEYLRVLSGDPVMRVRWAAASAFERRAEPEGFPVVVQLLAEVAPESKHIIRDILVSYAGRLQGRALSPQEVASLGLGPRAWNQWFFEFERRTRPAAGGARPS